MAKRKRLPTDPPVMPNGWKSRSEYVDTFEYVAFIPDDRDTISRDIQAAFPHLAPKRPMEWRDDEDDFDDD
jgi:hypothetical protein